MHKSNVSINTLIVVSVIACIYYESNNNHMEKYTIAWHFNELNDSELFSLISIDKQ